MRRGTRYHGRGISETRDREVPGTGRPEACPTVVTTIAVEIRKDTITPAARAMAARARNPIPGLKIAGRALGNLLKTHYREKAQTPNKLGGERSYFWLQVGRGVNGPEQTGKDTVSVSISHPAILQKIYGGIITAKRAKALTIPVQAQAYGRRASVLEHLLGLKLFRVKDALAAKGADGKLTIYYLLKRSVNQKPDPTALPAADKMQAAASDAFNDWMTGPELN